MRKLGTLKETRENLQASQEKVQKKNRRVSKNKVPVVGENEIADVVAGWTKIPVSRLTESEASRLQKLEETLHKRVIGQEEAVSADFPRLSAVVHRGTQRPEASDGFVPVFGPTGVGKTEVSTQGAKGLVVACNTATSAAVRKLREMYPYIPIVGIEPALKPAALCMEHPKVLVMATPMTIHEEKFHVLMERYKEKAQILPLPCPGLMDFIERGDLDGEDLHKYLEDLLYSYRENQVDAAVLRHTLSVCQKTDSAGVGGECENF